jgi:hypothetical protein
MRKLNKAASIAEQNKIMDRRKRLQSRIDAFQRKTTFLLNGHDVEEQDWEEHNTMSPDDVGMRDDSQDSSSDEEGTEDEEDCDPILAENASISLPSTIGKEACIRVGWIEMASQEMELRKGQANESLEKIRFALGHKALLYRTRVRKAKGQKAKTRTWGAIRHADMALRECVRSYGRARRALVNLGADNETLAHYQEIRREDLKLSGDVVEENRFGQKSDALAWFWRMGDQNKEQKDNWMSECEF